MTYIHHNQLDKFTDIKHGFSTKGHVVTSFHETLKLPKICKVHQIHGDDIVVANGVFGPRNLPKADGIITQKRNLPIGIVTADCGPVLFYDPIAKIIGAAHLGRKGVLLNLFQKMILKMEVMGAKRKNIIACIGPMIHKKNYEIDADIMTQIHSDYPQYQEALSFEAKPDHALFDMRKVIQSQAHETQVRCLDVDKCTYAQKDIFYSYRRGLHEGRTEKERMISVICLI